MRYLWLQLKLSEIERLSEKQMKKELLGGVCFAVAVDEQLLRQQKETEREVEQEGPLVAQKSLQKGVQGEEGVEEVEATEPCFLPTRLLLQQLLLLCCDVRMLQQLVGVLRLLVPGYSDVLGGVQKRILLQLSCVG